MNNLYRTCLPHSRLYKVLSILSTPLPPSEATQISLLSPLASALAHGPGVCYRFGLDPSLDVVQTRQTLL